MIRAASCPWRRQLWHVVCEGHSEKSTRRIHNGKRKGDAAVTFFVQTSCFHVSRELDEKDDDKDLVSCGPRLLWQCAVP